MASILDKYGIKEVADVTFYKINDDGSQGEPVLYLDTLKVSTIEQTAEQTEARGGKGNAPLLIWDYGKEINVTLEDALFSAKSMAIMFGNGNFSNVEASTIQRTVPTAGLDTNASTYELNGKKHKVTAYSLYTDTGATADALANAAYAVVTLETSARREIEISANSFPGTYKVVGDTYARSTVTGNDDFFQFIIERAKVQSENTITLEAEGDPSVFNMSLRVLRGDNGEMMKLVQYTLTEATEA